MVRDQQQPTALITGASSGIGAAASVKLSALGFRVIGVGRNGRRLDSLLSALNATSPGLGHLTLTSDISEMKSVMLLAEKVTERAGRIDVLVHNAAVQTRKRILTSEGLELMLAVNHLAPFLLNRALEPLVNASDGRVVITASSDHLKATSDLEDMQGDRSWSTMSAYARTKLYNVMFASALQQRGIVPATSFHPGDIRTAINRESRLALITRPFERFVYDPPEKGADTLHWLATSPEGAVPTGLYYVNRQVATHSPIADDVHLVDDLWSKSDAMISYALKRNISIY